MASKYTGVGNDIHIYKGTEKGGSGQMKGGGAKGGKAWGGKGCVGGKMKGY